MRRVTFREELGARGERSRVGEERAARVVVRGRVVPHAGLAEDEGLAQLVLAWRSEWARVKGADELTRPCAALRLPWPKIACSA